MFAINIGFLIVLAYAAAWLLGDRAVSAGVRFLRSLVFALPVVLVATYTAVLGWIVSYALVFVVSGALGFFVLRLRPARAVALAVVIVAIPLVTGYLFAR